MADEHAPGKSATDDELAEAIEVTGYVFTDPVTDTDWPRITGPDDENPPDAFPPTWSAAPTERDQAAIDAGNA